jgi:hypothetical protein
VDADFAWGFDAEPDLIPIDRYDDDPDVIADDDGLVRFTGQNEHSGTFEQKFRAARS